MGKVFWIVVIFLIVGGYMIRSNMELDLSDRSGQTTFAKEFGHWIAGVGRNIASVAGYAVKKDWLPEDSNSTTTTVTYILE